MALACSSFIVLWIISCLCGCATQQATSASGHAAAGSLTLDAAKVKA